MLTFCFTLHIGTPYIKLKLLCAALFNQISNNIVVIPMRIYIHACSRYCTHNLTTLNTIVKPK